MERKLDDQQLLEYSRLQSILKVMEGFVEKHPLMSYIEFDYYTVHDLTLFAVEPDFDFDDLKNVIQSINKVIPVMKRIFNKPIIYLKDTSDVLPVESVHIINQSTMLHVANHSEDVANITEEGIKPLKLMTRVYEDNYSLFENIIFCNFVDDVLRYCRRNIRNLTNIIYASEIMQFNILEKLNHLNYYLALGKLHTGYIRDFSRYYLMSKEMNADLLKITNSIQPYLKKPVYRKNKNRNRNLKIKKTNIFLMQKDYHQIYVAFKYLSNHNVIDEGKAPTVDFDKLNKDYFDFIKVLMIFAISHFNFETSPEEKINLVDLKTDFKFKNWKLTISSVEEKAFLLEISKDYVYRILILPSIGKQNDEGDVYFKNKYVVNELIIFTPFEEDYQTRKATYVSIEDIDSFKRIQQIILRGMIYSDKVKDTCPFCGATMKQTSDNDVYECESCRTQIKKKTCPNTNKNYYITKIAHFDQHVIQKSEFIPEESILYGRKIESALFFRNITKINAHQENICPKCGEIHRD